MYHDGETFRKIVYLLCKSLFCCDTEVITSNSRQQKTVLKHNPYLLYVTSHVTEKQADRHIQAWYLYLEGEGGEEVVGILNESLKALCGLDLKKKKKFNSEKILTRTLCFCCHEIKF